MDLYQKKWLQVLGKKVWFQNFGNMWTKKMIETTVETRFDA